MAQQQKSVRLSILIAALGIIIGFMGELMPDTFKTAVTTWTEATFNMSFLKVWVICTVLLVILSLYLVWREAIFNRETLASPTPSNGKRHVEQHGPKSVYIEKNEGDITIN